MIRRGRRKKGSSSGISEIVATVLMLAIVVGLSIVLLSYASTGLFSFASGFTNLLSNSGDALSEQVVIEQITFNKTGSQLGANIYVRNVGSVTAYVAAIYVQNLTSSSFVTSVQLSPSIQLNVGSFQQLVVHFTPDSGDAYSLTIATTRGNTVVADAKA